MRLRLKVILYVLMGLIAWVLGMLIHTLRGV